jgi:hypothetical protein
MQDLIPIMLMALSIITLHIQHISNIPFVPHLVSHYEMDESSPSYIANVKALEWMEKTHFFLCKST